MMSSSRLYKQYFTVAIQRNCCFTTHLRVHRRPICHFSGVSKVFPILVIGIGTSLRNSEWLHRKNHEKIMKTIDGSSCPSLYETHLDLLCSSLQLPNIPGELLRSDTPGNVSNHRPWNDVKWCHLRAVCAPSLSKRHMSFDFWPHWFWATHCWVKINILHFFGVGGHWLKLIILLPHCRRVGLPSEQLILSQQPTTLQSYT